MACKNDSQFDDKVRIMSHLKRQVSIVRGVKQS
jgi:hypothetical protein